MIFILNPNPISLRFKESWSFNMVSETGLAGGLGFKSPLCNLFSFVDLRVHEGLYLACLILYVRDGATCEGGC